MITFFVNYFLLIYILSLCLLILINFAISRQYFSLYLSWILLLFIWLYTEISQIPEKPERHLAYLWTFVFIFILSLAILIRVCLISSQTNNNLTKLTTEQNYILRAITKITLAIYGLMSAYLLHFHYGDILVGYQPAWKAYIIVFMALLLILILSKIIEKNKLGNTERITKKFKYFSYSLCAVMSVLLILSLSFPDLIIRETNKVVQQYDLTSSSYCIQMPNIQDGKKYKAISTLLDLSPLTLQSIDKPHSWYGWVKPYFHALLVVKKPNSTDLYNWSYKQRKWSYLAPGLAKKANITQPEIVCHPQHNYLQQIPWIFPIDPEKRQIR